MKRTPQAKSQAAILVREMAAAGNPIKHQQALEMVAKMSGFRDWNAMVAAPEAPQPVAVPESPPANPADGAKLRQLIKLATEVSDCSDTTGCDGDLTVTTESSVSNMMDFIKKLESPAYSSNPAASFDPTSQIMVTWSLHDVLSIRPDLTEAEAFDVLFYAKRKYDAQAGLNWDVLGEHADWLFRRRKLECELTFKDNDGNLIVTPALVDLMDGNAVTVGGTPLAALTRKKYAIAKFAALPSEEFRVQAGKLFGQEDDDDQYEREQATRKLIAKLAKEDALPLIGNND